MNACGKSFMVLLLLGFACLMFACSATCGLSKGKKLTADQANELAVKLANEECKTKFKSEPFDANSYKPMLDNTIWTWGQLEPAGMQGYSAIATFDAYGNKRTVQVAFASDQLGGLSK